MSSTEKGFAVLFPGERVKEERMRKTTGQERERVSHECLICMTETTRDRETKREER